MKKWGWLLGVLVFISGVLTWRKVNPPLRVPTPQQLNKALSSNTIKVLENSQEFILLSLDPSGPDSYEGKQAFHGYRIVGQVHMNSTGKARLLAAFYDALAEDDISRAACFGPRHGIHASGARRWWI